MKKYLVIILIILLMYTVYQCWNLTSVTTEGFAEVPTNVDTATSIATLAQIATDLQAGGGLKVPGKLDVLSNANITGSLNLGNGLHNFNPGGDKYVRLQDSSGNMTDFAVGNMWMNGTFQSALLVDSSTGNGIGLYHPKNGYMLFSLGATTGDSTKAGWNQVNIRGDDFQFKNANGGPTTVTTNGNQNITGNSTVGGKLLNSKGLGFEIVAASIGSYNGPIFGPGDKTYSTADYMCMQSGHYYVHNVAAAGPMIYEKDGIWWVKNFNQGVWADANFLMIPKSFMSGYTGTNRTNGKVDGTYTESPAANGKGYGDNSYAYKR